MARAEHLMAQAEQEHRRDHFCLGHFVARRLEQVMLEELFTRLPSLRPDPAQPPVVHGWAVRAAKRLPVVWDA
jgi:aromatic O-demethylase, cytochrome P450 subunit